MQKLMIAAALLVLPACSDPRCSQKPEPGRVYFDPQLGRCATFTWGGCAGVRPFVTMNECKAVCE